MSTVIQFPAPEAPTEGQQQEEFLRGVMEEFPFAIEGQADADLSLDYLMEKLAERQQQIALNNEVADRRVAMIEGWRSQANASHEREARWLRMLIHAIAEKYQFPKGKKSRELPHGKFGFRRSPDTIDIVDMEKAVAFAKANGLPIKEEVLKTPLKKFWEPKFKDAAEVPEVEETGFDYRPGEDSFYVNV